VLPEELCQPLGSKPGKTQWNSALPQAGFAGDERPRLQHQHCQKGKF